MEQEQTFRQAIAEAKRVVLKIGTRVLVAADGNLELDSVRQIVAQVLELREAGKEVVLVTSAAIGAGLRPLALSSRPKELADLQMVAAVGQVKLMLAYEQFFSEADVSIGQVLLTHGDLTDRRRYLNARNTLSKLLERGVVPVVNENDVVSVNEIRFGDNDVLAALSAMLVDAEALVLLSSVDGFQVDGKLQSFIANVEEDFSNHIHSNSDGLSSGGMGSKLQSARTAAENGISVIIADGREPEVIKKILAAESVGTVIAAGEREHRSKKQWIAFFNKSQGKIIVDDGAAKAVSEQGRSLLPAGVTAIEGDFTIGSTVSIESSSGVELARGLSNYAAETISLIKGRRSSEVNEILEAPSSAEVVHRDNLVVLGEKNGR